MDIKNCTAYRLIQKQDLKELATTGYVLEHKKTKAKIVLMENDDNNKVFTIGFRTPPKDSTGVAHIVEHTVLCGSREFPVKDPFIELAKGSLNTFLNAMTYPDKTVYPVASCNEKDFQNLMHVYLDAVFYPNIYHEEKIFKQEGWHYELESTDAPLTYNGVVFNEMKGVYSQPEQLLFRNIQNALFPDTPYSVESGGDPEAIPNLTYEDYLDFHGKYYHPSNSYIYLYGDMDMEEQLNWIDEHYLKDFDYLEVDSAIAIQKPFDERNEKNGFYSVTEEEDVDGKTYLSLNYCIGTSQDAKLYTALQVLEYVLLDSVGALVKQALLDAGIGTEITGGFEGSLQQLTFSFVAKNARMDQKDDFIRVVEDALKKIVDEGVNRKSLVAALNAMEFQYREADFGSYPKGLMYGLQMFDSWLYDENHPFIHVACDSVYEELRRDIDSDYYEELIRRSFLTNTHSAVVSLQPKVGLTALLDEEEKARLAAYRETLSEEELARIVRETKELKEYQEEPTDPETLKCIPLLAREDIGKKAQPYSNCEMTFAGLPGVHHDYHTNGIDYIRLAFDVKDLKEYVPYIGLLTEIISSVDTEQRDKLELSNEILTHSGNFAMTATSYEKKDSEDYDLQVELTTKVFYREVPYMMNLIGEILTQSKLRDFKRLKEIIGECRSDQQTRKMASGHMTAANRALAYMSERMYYMEQLRGVAYYDFICDLDDHFEEKKEELADLLQALAAKIFVTSRMSVAVTADKEGAEILAEEMEKLTSQLPEKVSDELPQRLWPLKKIQPNEGFKTASKVHYVARAGKFFGKGIDRDGSFRVVKTILSYDYLWNEVRVKGGAYGVMCAFTPFGVGYMMSYRDPNLAETNEVYEGVPEYLEQFECDERDMMKYIIGTISEMDTPLTPRGKGARSYSAYKTGVTFEDCQNERNQVLATDQKRIRQAANMVRAVLSDGYICALGGESKIESDKELFETVRVLK
ncbi:MAG: insulinase family protein [Eubacterium sp.]|nr:insulinase family protein [Eubacterium sp.]